MLKKSIICIIGVPKREEGMEQEKKTLEQLMHELTPKLINVRLQSTDSRSSVDPKHNKPKTNTT